tara:strand:- start:33 stop:425 length:393 start_codon:yes stop_codon:yes gene_type:complete
MATTTGKMEPTRELTGRSHSLRASKKNRAALAEAYAEAKQSGKAKEAFYFGSALPSNERTGDARPADYEHSTCLCSALRRVSDTESNIKLGLFNANQAGIFPFDFPTIWGSSRERGLLGKPTRAASAHTA